MAVNNRPTFAYRPSLSAAKLVNADGTNAVDLISAGDSGNKVVGIFATGEVTANRDVQLVLERGADSFILTTVAVPLNSGRTNALPPVDLFTEELRALLPKDADAQPYLFIMAEDVLQVKVLSAVTAAEQLSVMAVHASFDDEA